ncbi:hypothetical protein ACLB2K_009924 [Fragaria x ananassa]
MKIRKMKRNIIYRADICASDVYEHYVDFVAKKDKLCELKSLERISEQLQAGILTPSKLRNAIYNRGSRCLVCSCTRPAAQQFIEETGSAAQQAEQAAEDALAAKEADAAARFANKAAEAAQLAKVAAESAQLAKRTKETVPVAKLARKAAAAAQVAKKAAVAAQLAEDQATPEATAEAVVVEKLGTLLL